MLMTRTPFRISFTGGSSDLPEYLEKTGYGCVISSAINKYMYIALNKNFYNNYILKYSNTEIVESTEHIKHPILRTAITKSDLIGIDLASFSDIPSGTGLGSSSAFTVGVLNALKSFKNEKFTQLELAKLAQEIEITDLNGNLGYQDQLGCALPGVKFIEFIQDNKINFKITEFNLKTNYEFVLAFTNKVHNTNLELSTKKDFNLIDDLVQLTLDLKNNKISFVDCIKENWKIKSKYSGFNDVYQLGLKSGAICGKLLGSGNGGFFLFLTENSDEFISKMPLKCLKVKTDFEGTKCILKN